MNRYVFWCLVAITCTVVFFGTGTASSLTGTIMSTTGNVGGVVVGNAPKLIEGFRDGVKSGDGGASDSLFQTGTKRQDQQPRRGNLNAAKAGR